MDGEQFDNVLRGVTRSLSRRHLTLGMAIVCLGAVVADPLDEQDAEAASKSCSKKKKKKSRWGEFAAAKKKCKPKKKIVRPTSPPPPPCAEATCPPLHAPDPANNCQCISTCPAGLEPCNGQCVPTCPNGAPRNPITCLCCLPAGVTCNPAPSPALPCCLHPTDACPVTNICPGNTAGQPCQFGGQCQAPLNCVNGVCTAP